MSNKKSTLLQRGPDQHTKRSILVLVFRFRKAKLRIVPILPQALTNTSKGKKITCILPLHTPTHTTSPYLHSTITQHCLTCIAALSNLACLSSRSSLSMRNRSSAEVAPTFFASVVLASRCARSRATSLRHSRTCAHKSNEPVCMSIIIC